METTYERYSKMQNKIQKRWLFLGAIEAVFFLDVLFNQADLTISLLSLIIR